MASRSAAALSPTQRQTLAALARELPFVDPETWVERAALRWGDQDDFLRSLAPTTARRHRARRELTNAARDAVHNRGVDQRWRASQRKREKRVLEALCAVSEDLLRMPTLRGRLYVAAESEAIRDDPRGLSRATLEDGCFFAKHRDEGGNGLGVVTDPRWLDLNARLYDPIARHPGPWVRDDLVRLRDAARLILTTPPFRATRHDPWTDHLVRGCHDAWWWATGDRPTAGRPNRSGLGPFGRFVQAAFEVVESVHVGESAIAARIQAALRRERRGLSAS